MIKRNRYQLMTEGASTDSAGNSYPDPLSLKIKTFEHSQIMKPHVLTQVEIDRFDLFLYKEYSNCYYGDIILLLNKAGNIHEFSPGDKIELPLKEDIETFYIKNRK